MPISRKPPSASSRAINPRTESTLSAEWVFRGALHKEFDIVAVYQMITKSNDDFLLEQEYAREPILLQDKQELN
jgi:hypothetical protein